MKARKTGAVVVCTKPADKTIHRLGWPVVDTWDEVRQHPNVIFWPRTKRMGTARRAYHEAAISDLLHRLWKPDLVKGDDDRMLPLRATRLDRLPSHGPPSRGGLNLPSSWHGRCGRIGPRPPLI